MATAETKKPVETLKKNGVKAAIWGNQGKDGLFYSVTFNRSYKDAEGNWKNSTSFTNSDLDALIDLSIRAKNRIAKYTI